MWNHPTVYQKMQHQATSALTAWRERCLTRKRQRLMPTEWLRMCNLLPTTKLWLALVTQKRHAQGVVSKHLRMMNATVYAAWCVVY